jgi:hypothetical protein|tara:strand:- start:372 stop:596 length:225 start_codon:yes stop_codon:yes gene_type:complete
MSKKNHSSFKNDKKRFDSWRHFLNESAAPGAVVLEKEELTEKLEGKKKAEYEKLKNKKNLSADEKERKKELKHQ